MVAVNVSALSATGDDHVPSTRSDAHKRVKPVQDASAAPLFRDLRVESAVRCRSAHLARGVGSLTLHHGLGTAEILRTPAAECQPR
jgi:hypothetical protein